MISQYSRPQDIDREFWLDKEKAMYWLKKHTSRKSVEWQLMEDGCDVMDGKCDYKFSEPIFYTSPQTGNRWLLYIAARRDKQGIVRLYYRPILYFFTECYMTIMVAITMCEENDEGERRSEQNGVNVYTAHMFQRMHERLGVDMSDRIRAIRNFCEFVGTGWSDTRPPRKGEKHTQVMMRTPASWIKGHTIDVGDRFVTIYRTFYTDASMTQLQRNYVKSFSKFADKMMRGEVKAKPDNEENKDGETAVKELTKHIIKNNGI